MTKRQPVGLFFLPNYIGGGSTSFTVHLYLGLRKAGFEPCIYRVRPDEKLESIKRKFGKYETVFYQNIDWKTAINVAKRMPTLLTAPTHSKHLPFKPDLIPLLMQNGMRIVIHDPNEFKVYDHLTGDIKHPFCIRPTMKKFFKDAIFIPHPYVRQFEHTAYNPYDNFFKQRQNAVSVARITFVKRTEIILEANKLLPKDKQVILRGAENRLYTFVLKSKGFPKFKQGIYGYPQTLGASAIELSKGKFAVDMTWFPDDGGGSQYSFMEAWDAGAINVINKDWLRFPGEMVADRNCLAIADAADLADVLNKGISYRASIIEDSYDDLAKHEAGKIARRYMKELLK